MSSQFAEEKIQEHGGRVFAEVSRTYFIALPSLKTQESRCTNDCVCSAGLLFLGGVIEYLACLTGVGV